MYIFVAMAKNRLPDFKLFNVKHLAESVNLPYAKLRDNLMGKYQSLDHQDETRIYNAMREEFEKACLALGFSFEGKRVKPKSD